MFIVLKGAPFQGSVTMRAFGPFHTEDEAVNWAVKEWEAEPEWFILDVTHPRDYNPEEVQDIDPDLLERMIAQADQRVKDEELQKEVMLDLSEIPVGT